MINYSLALSRHRIFCATHDTQFCLAIQIQRNEQSGTKRRIKRHGTYCKCTNSSAHVANLARGFRSPEHHHEESRRAQYTGRHSTALTSPSRAGVPRKDTIEKRRANGWMKESMEGRRKRRRKEGRRSKRNAESRGTRGIIRPSTPQAHSLPPPFSYPLHHLPRATPLDHSRHSSYLPPSSVLHLSLFSLYLSFFLLRPCFSHFVTFYFTPCLDFMRIAKWGYLFRLYSNKCARNSKIIVNLSLKLISSFRVF